MMQNIKALWAATRLPRLSARLTAETIAFSCQRSGHTGVSCPTQTPIAAMLRN